MDRSTVMLVNGIAAWMERWGIDDVNDIFEGGKMISIEDDQLCRESARKRLRP